MPDVSFDVAVRVYQMEQSRRIRSQIAGRMNAGDASNHKTEKQSRSQDTMASTVEPGRCGEFVAWIDLLLSPQPPKVSDRVDFLRAKVPVGGCDVRVVRERNSKYFRFSIKDKDELSEYFRFANDTLVGYFSIDLKSMEIPKLTAVIHAKKIEDDYL